MENNIKQDVAGAAGQWKEALESGSPDKVAGLYRKDAVLWGTLSPVRRSGPEAIRGYFVSFAAKKNIQVRFTDQKIRQYGDFAINTGYYTFSWEEGDHMVSIPARYSFTYMRSDTSWMILDHHSSLVPETPFDISGYIT